MAKFGVDLFVLEAFSGLFGVRAFLEFTDEAIPRMEWQEREALRQLAEGQGWDFGDYAVECDILDEKFRRWIPRLAAYSTIILLHSVVETQLARYADRVGKSRGSAFQVKDLKDRGIDQARLYLERVASVSVGEDPAWQHLRNLQRLRNIIVHRAGKQGDSEDDQKTVKALLRAYPGKLQVGPRGELFIPTALCRQFVQEIEAFFKRIFKAAGFLETGVKVEV